MNEESLRAEYEQVNQNFRALADVRFKLLALIPTVGGIAAFLISNIAFKTPDNPLVLAISVFGFMATLGITFYDQRNSELYNSLFDRAQFLEKQLQLPENPERPKSARLPGGQFRERPQRTKRLLFIKFGHDTGLALIYAPMLGVWTFPTTLFLSGLASYSNEVSLQMAFAISGLVTLLFLEELLRLDGVWRRLKNKFKSLGSNESKA